MPDNDTLLAYLVSSFPGNTENIATEALRHIFDHSDASVEALNDVVQSGARGRGPGYHREIPGDSGGWNNS